MTRRLPDPMSATLHLPDAKADVETTYTYRAFGLGIHSEIPLPELVEDADAPADVTVRLGAVPRTPGREQRRTYGSVCSSPEMTYVVQEGVGVLLTREGREIVVDPLSGVDEDLLHVFVTGVALGGLLHQRGFLVLHASAVAIDGQVVAFIGEKGWGKSTTAAALHARGHLLISDDAVAIQLGRTGEIQVVPGFPQLKLWPDSVVAALGDDPQALGRIYGESEKRIRRSKAQFSQDALPLGGIYVLGGGDELALERLAPGEAFQELITHSYAARILHLTRTGPLHLKQCGRVISTLPVVRLKRPRALERLPELITLIEEDVRARQQR